MIEHMVVLRSDGTAALSGKGYELLFGYSRNAGLYAVRIVPQGVWAGLVIRACWHIPGNPAPPSTLAEKDLLCVPAAVTAESGKGVITFEGTDGNGVTVTSADVPYRVSANSGMDDGPMPDPGTPAWEAFVANAYHIATDVEAEEMLSEIFK